MKHELLPLYRNVTLDRSASSVVVTLNRWAITQSIAGMAIDHRTFADRTKDHMAGMLKGKGIDCTAAVSGAGDGIINRLKEASEEGVVTITLTVADPQDLQRAFETIDAIAAQSRKSAHAKY